MSNNQPILSVKNFSLDYEVPHYQSRSIRDSFVNFFSRPLDYLFGNNERIIVLKNVSFNLMKGERLGLVGNNAAGKTSICRHIAGFFGENQNIKINGNVRSIFDAEVVILPELSGRENLKLLALLFYPELTRIEINELVEECIQFSEIGKFADVPYKLYSKGMRARLCLSLISAKPSDLLILDEVFNGADHFFTEKMNIRIKNLIEQSGAVIFISHSLDLVKEVCNRAIVFHNQSIIFDGKPELAINYYYENCQSSLIQNG